MSTIEIPGYVQEAAMRLADDHESTTCVQQDDGSWRVVGGRCIGPARDHFIPETVYGVTEDGTTWVISYSELPIYSGGKPASPELAAELRAEYRDDDRYGDGGEED